MPIIAEFTDPRLVAIYETVNAYLDNAQPRFYGELAAELGAASIIDLGCGTGLITIELARQGYRLTGIDPAPAMIEVARNRPDGEMVNWVVGDATSLRGLDADLAIMTGHVAQFFLTDASWHVALTRLQSALRQGGRLAFESRNPEAREWESWTSGARWTAHDPVAGQIEVWSEVQDVRDGTVSYANHYAFATGEHLVSPNKLRFRSEEELSRSLADAGFAVQRVYGDWDRRSANTTTPELIVVAIRNL